MGINIQSQKKYLSSLLFFFIVKVMIRGNLRLLSPQVMLQSSFRYIFIKVNSSVTKTHQNYSCSQHQSCFKTSPILVCFL